jgi:hypothetical protein
MQNEKACFSRVGIMKEYDYSLTFADIQELQLFRQKLLRILSVLDSCSAVAKGCERHCRQLHTLKATLSYDMVLDGLQTYADQIDRYRRNVATLMEYSSGTSNLVCLPFLQDTYVEKV